MYTVLKYSFRIDGLVYDFRRVKKEKEGSVTSLAVRRAFNQSINRSVANDFVMHEFLTRQVQCVAFFESLAIFC